MMKKPRTRKRGAAVDSSPNSSSPAGRAVAVAGAGAAAVSAEAADRASAAGTPAELAGILERLPADDYQTAHKLCERLLADGPATIEELVGMVGEVFGDPKGVKPKYALHGLAGYASRPGAGGQRKLLAETLAGQLSAGHSGELKAFIVRQLQLCGRPEEVPALAKLLSSERLCSPASQALVAIGGQPARKALREALPTLEGSRRVAVGQALEILSRE